MKDNNYLIYVAKELITGQLNKLKTIEGYWGTAEQIDAANTVTQFIEKVIGWEEDEQATNYFLKATQEEIFNYYLTNVLPKLLK